LSLWTRLAQRCRGVGGIPVDFAAPDSSKAAKLSEMSRAALIISTRVRAP
jgi:hypothetical protein